MLVTLSKNEEFEDGRILNKEAMAKIRDAWVYKQVRARSGEFTEYKQVRTRKLFCLGLALDFKNFHRSIRALLH